MLQSYWKFASRWLGKAWPFNHCVERSDSIKVVCEKSPCEAVLEVKITMNTKSFRVARNMGHLLRNASSLEWCLPRRECAHRGGLSTSLGTQVMPAHTLDTSQRSSWLKVYFSESCFYIGSFFPFHSVPPIWRGNVFLEPLHIESMWSFVNLWEVHRQLNFVTQRVFGTWTFDRLELQWESSTMRNLLLLWSWVLWFLVVVAAWAT